MIIQKEQFANYIKQYERLIITICLSFTKNYFDAEDLIEEQDSVITLTHFGYIKRLPTDTYKSQRRGGKGIKTYKISEKTGNVVSGRVVRDVDEMMLINSNGIIIRINVKLENNYKHNI